MSDSPAAAMDADAAAGGAPTAPAAALFAFPSRPEDRLRLALRRLDAAIAAQREAVAAWRAELGRLGVAVQGLEGSVTDLRHGLDGTADALRRAGEEARRLDRTADAMLALAAGRPDSGVALAEAAVTAR